MAGVAEVLMLNDSFVKLMWIAIFLYTGYEVERDGERAV